MKVLVAGGWVLGELGEGGLGWDGMGVRGLVQGVGWGPKAFKWPEANNERGCNNGRRPTMKKAPTADRQIY